MSGPLAFTLSAVLRPAMAPMAAACSAPAAGALHNQAHDLLSRAAPASRPRRPRGPGVDTADALAVQMPFAALATGWVLSRSRWQPAMPWQQAIHIITRLVLRGLVRVLRFRAVPRWRIEAMPGEAFGAEPVPVPRRRRSGLGCSC